MPVYIIAFLVVVQFAMSTLFIFRIFRSFQSGELAFAAQIIKRADSPGKFWGFMGFYAICLFATVLVGLLLMSLI